METAQVLKPFNSIFIRSLIRKKCCYYIFMQEKLVQRKFLAKWSWPIFLFCWSKCQLLFPFVYLPLVHASLPLHWKHFNGPWHETCIKWQISGRPSLLWSAQHLLCGINITVLQFLFKSWLRILFFLMSFCKSQSNIWVTGMSRNIPKH